MGETALLPRFSAHTEQLCAVGEDGVAECWSPYHRPLLLLWCSHKDASLPTGFTGGEESWAASLLTDSKKQCLVIVLNQWILEVVPYAVDRQL